MSDHGTGVEDGDDTVDLGSPPSLLPLYVRAALPRGGGDVVPATTLRLRDVRPEPDHVAEYARVCGFRLAGTLPLTYPHLLGFPLQVRLMADRAFPFPATGLVHVANTVEQHRPVPVTARLTVTVHAEGLAPHPRGRLVHMLTSVSADGEVAWTSTSTYLRRGRGDESAARQEPDVPADLPTTAVRRLPADLGRRYAAVSGDRNPIHLSALSARAFGFPRAIAHGMWSTAACVAALEGHLDAATRLDVAFKAPALLPSTVELATRVHGDGRADAVLRSRGGRTHLLARAERIG